MGSDRSTEIYIEAYRYAATAHWNSDKKQLVPGTDIPYLMHFSLVAGKNRPLSWMGGHGRNEFLKKIPETTLLHAFLAQVLHFLEKLTHKLWII